MDAFDAFSHRSGAVMIAIGVFLVIFYGVYIKRKEAGPGVDTPLKRIHLYGDIALGAFFVGGGLIFILMV